MQQRIDEMVDAMSKLKMNGASDENVIATQGTQKRKLTPKLSST
jgi:hypothetical protein